MTICQHIKCALLDKAVDSQPNVLGSLQSLNTPKKDCLSILIGGTIKESIDNGPKCLCLQSRRGGVFR